MGAKSAEVLRLISDTTVDLVERRSGHRGSFGVMKPTSATARKAGHLAALSPASRAELSRDFA